MTRPLDIAQKDLLQLVRDHKVFLFLLVMPIVFTFMFGYAFGAFSKAGDMRFPLGYLDLDGSWQSQALRGLLEESQVVRLVIFPPGSRDQLEAQVRDEKLAAALIVPPRYGAEMLHNRRPRLELIGDTDLPVGMTIKSEALSAVQRLDSALGTALTLEPLSGGSVPFRYAFDQALAAWQNPPIGVSVQLSQAEPETSEGVQQLAHFAPGMMLQFAIAGLLTAAQIMVVERKSRALQRMLTTAAPPREILAGHYLAIFLMIAGQFAVLIGLGQFVLGVDYLHAPLATLAVAFCAALCIAALGLLIGTLAKTEEQAVVFSLVPMFVLSGVGGAWVPLDVTGRIFQTFGHLSPVAWAMDGFKNITIRGLGLSEAIVPCLALAGYALLFVSLAGWRFSKLD